jgi:predicted metal-dependent HD superfamily phosphohydrolase
LKCIILSNQIRQNDSSSKAGFFIENLFKDKLSPAFLYHNYKHTQEVVANAEILANADNLNEEEKEILLVACWFHDSGYTEDIMLHEEKSCEIAAEFLKAEGVNEDFIRKVKELIMSTKVCCKPDNELKILSEMQTAAIWQVKIISLIRII